MTKTIHILFGRNIILERHTAQVLLNHGSTRFKSSHNNDSEKRVTEVEDKKPEPPMKIEAPTFMDIFRPRKRYFELGIPIPQRALKKYRVEEHLVDMSQFTDETVWFPCYKSKLATQAYTIARAKVYMTGISLYIVGHAIWQFFMDPTSETLIMPLIVSGTTLTGLFFMGNFMRKFIVQIYLCEDNEHVRISRFSAFGRRLDIVIPREAIYPLAETNTSFRSPILKVKFKKPDGLDLSKENLEFYEEDLHLSLVFGNVINVAKMERAMGKITLGLATG